jgi:hypothetical protein
MFDIMYVGSGLYSVISYSGVNAEESSSPEIMDMDIQGLINFLHGIDLQDQQIAELVLELYDQDSVEVLVSL